MNRFRKIAAKIFPVLLSIVFLWLAYTLIQFEDRYKIEYGDEILTAESVETSGEGYHAVFPGGDARSFPEEGTRVTFQPGFLSLFNRMNKGLFFVLLPFFIFPLLFLSLRWKILLRATGFEVSIGRVFLITYIGVFFNNFLPGSVGGDIARGLIAAKGKERKAVLVGTILLDRVIGLAAMILLSTVCVLPFLADSSMRLPVWIVLGLFFGMNLAYFIYFNRTLRGLLPGGGEKGRIRRIFSDLDAAFLLVKGQKRVVVLSLLLSLLGQGSIIALTYGLSRTINVTQASLLQFFIFEPIIFMIAALPVSVGGWGIQEGAYVFFFGKAGVPPNGAVAISILLRLTLIFVSIPGGILLALGGARRGNESGSDPEISRAGGNVSTNR